MIPEINLTYQEMAEHYGVAVVPARVVRPRDKAKVEVGVQNVERWILARLRDQKFFSLLELNQAIRELLEDLNDRKMEHLGKSRRELFELVDQPALKPLPATPYEFALWKKAKISIDYHVEYDDHYYSVPCQLYPADVLIRATEKTVEIFLDGKRVALHPRSQCQRQAFHPSRNICLPITSSTASGRRNVSSIGPRKSARRPPKLCKWSSLPGSIRSRRIVPVWGFWGLPRNIPPPDWNPPAIMPWPMKSTATGESKISS